MTDAADAPMRALDEAIEICGGTVVAFAAAISTAELPVSQNKVCMWRARRSVPSNYCPAIERETAKRGRPVLCERFQPRVDWCVLREPAPSKPRARPKSNRASAGLAIAPAGR